MIKELITGFFFLHLQYFKVGCHLVKNTSDPAFVVSVQEFVPEFKRCYHIGGGHVFLNSVDVYVFAFYIFYRISV